MLEEMDGSQGSFNQQLCFGCMRPLPGKAMVCPYCGYHFGMPQSAMYIQPGTFLAQRYLVGKVLAYDGYFVTYLAFDSFTQQKVTLKEYFPREYAIRLSDGRVNSYAGGAAQAFQNGALRYWEEENSPQRRGLSGVVRILDVVQAMQTAYVVLEYVEGRTLRSYMQQSGPLPFSQAKEIFKSILQTLSGIHKAGLTYRELIPENVILDNQGEILLQDFGTAPLMLWRSYTEDPLWKMGYAPPELSGQKGQWYTQSDLYVAGSLFYEMITSYAPTDAQTRAKGNDLVPPSKLKAVLEPFEEEVVLKSLSLAMQDRFQGAIEFLEALEKKPSSVKKFPGVKWLIPVAALGMGIFVFSLFGKRQETVISNEVISNTAQAIDSTEKEIEAELNVSTDVENSESKDNSSTEETEGSSKKKSTKSETEGSSEKKSSKSETDGSSEKKSKKTETEESSEEKSETTEEKSSKKSKKKSQTVTPTPSVVSENPDYLADEVDLSYWVGMQKMETHFVNETGNPLLGLHILKSKNKDVVAEILPGAEAEWKKRIESKRLAVCDIWLEEEIDGEKYNTYIPNLSMYEISDLHFYEVDSYVYAVYEDAEGTKHKTDKYKFYQSSRHRYSRVDDLFIYLQPTEGADKQNLKYMVNNDVTIWGMALGGEDGTEDWYIVGTEEGYGFIKAFEGSVSQNRVEHTPTPTPVPTLNAALEINELKVKSITTTTDSSGYSNSNYVDGGYYDSGFTSGDYVDDTYYEDGYTDNSYSDYNYYEYNYSEPEYDYGFGGNSEIDAAIQDVAQHGGGSIYIETDAGTYVIEVEVD